ncbi:type IV toxin-antitoxin system AbiEi family antitoxin domain-containing protein [Mumia qirimensis]|uniref:type IV toxin-antitoxin system AbiEi family antitoxin domain-containing protein n=1 Tax=Mumia qirimensis TaxID=3234852 RepID=UPI00351D43E2
MKGGFVTRVDALECGYGDHDLRDALRSGSWVSVRRGVYAPRETYARLTPRERHLLLLRTVLAEKGPGWFATHDSAVVAHELGDYGLGTYELDLTVAHVARTGGATSRRTASFQTHRAAVDPATTTNAAGLPSVEAARAVVATMTKLSLDAATVLASTWLARQRRTARESGRSEEFDEEDARARLRALLDDGGARPGTRVARDAIDVADARCESVGEVRFLVLCWEHGLPRPETQIEVAIPGGRAEVDFMWRNVGMIVEFDGMLKYEDDTGPEGRKAKDNVIAEKRRERALRELGWHVVRVTWADLAPANRERTAAYLRRELERAAKMRARQR